ASRALHVTVQAIFFTTPDKKKGRRGEREKGHKHFPFLICHCSGEVRAITRLKSQPNEKWKMEKELCNTGVQLEIRNRKRHPSVEVICDFCRQARCGGYWVARSSFSSTCSNSNANVAWCRAFSYGNVPWRRSRPTPRSASCAEIYYSSCNCSPLRRWFS